MAEGSPLGLTLRPAASTAESRAAPRHSTPESLEAGSAAKEEGLEDFLARYAVAAALQAEQSLRPYFSFLDTKIVFRKLVYALLPRLRDRRSAQQTQRPDLYGPLMLSFLMASVLQLSMKHSGIKIVEGTLIGTSLLLSFAYWFGASAAFYAVGFFCASSLSRVEVLSAVGYSIFGQVVVLWLNSVVWSKLFYPAFFTVGFGSASVLAVKFFQSIRGPEKASIAALVVGLVHLAWLLFLRRTFAMIVTFAAG